MQMLQKLPPLTSFLVALLIFYTVHYYSEIIFVITSSFHLYSITPLKRTSIDSYIQGFGHHWRSSEVASSLNVNREEDIKWGDLAYVKGFRGFQYNYITVALDEIRSAWKRGHAFDHYTRTPRSDSEFSTVRFFYYRGNTTIFQHFRSQNRYFF
jgi:hypothetical protein